MLLVYLTQTHKVFTPVNDVPNVLFLQIVHMQVIDPQSILKTQKTLLHLTNELSIPGDYIKLKCHKYFKIYFSANLR